MRVTEITVSAGRTFSHPYEEFANLKPYLTFRATLDEGDDRAEVVRALQAEAESMIEDHKQAMLESLRALHLMSEYQRKVAGLELNIKRAQEELERLREQQAELCLPAPESEHLEF